MAKEDLVVVVHYGKLEGRNEWVRKLECFFSFYLGSKVFPWGAAKWKSYGGPVLKVI